jgi:hypothetical protein
VRDAALIGDRIIALSGTIGSSWIRWKNGL